MPSASPQPAETLTVIMPVYNEQRTLREVVGRVLAAPVSLPLELLCVDDGSRDDSLSLLRELAATEPRIRIESTPQNSGKGAAVRLGIDHAAGSILLIQDADLEYDPQDYPALLEPLLAGRADAVYGSRFAGTGHERVHFFWHTLANRLLTLFSNLVNGMGLTDMETCYKAVRADILKELHLTSERFGIEPEVTTRLAQWGARIEEVPIRYERRTYAEGKKIGLWDAVEAVATLIRCRYLDRRVKRETL